MEIVSETTEASLYVTQDKAEAKCAELTAQHKDQGFHVQREMLPAGGLTEAYIISVSAADGEFLGFYSSGNNK